LLIFNEFDNCYEAANKFVKIDLKNGKDLDNIYSKDSWEKKPSRTLSFTLL